MYVINTSGTTHYHVTLPLYPMGKTIKAVIKDVQIILHNYSNIDSNDNCTYNYTICMSESLDQLPAKR